MPYADGGPGEVSGLPENLMRLVRIRKRENDTAA
jgi:hypothetical protein